MCKSARKGSEDPGRVRVVVVGGGMAGVGAALAAALSIKQGVAPRNTDVAELQRILVKNNCNIGQGYRKLPALEDEDYSAYAISHKASNG